MGRDRRGTKRGLIVGRKAVALENSTPPAGVYVGVNRGMCARRRRRPRKVADIDRRCC